MKTYIQYLRHKISNTGLPYIFLIVLITAGSVSDLKAQAPEIPIPVEMFYGHDGLYYQVTVKRQFSPESRFGYFGLATYTADYQNDIAENRMITIAQFDYEIGKGFGVMAGTDVNNVSGYSPIIGPRFSYASKKWLIVNSVSYFLNEEKDIKLFGLYEFLPAINENWTFYSRLQYIYSRSLGEDTHNKSYIYLRAGLQKDRLIFGMGANVDWSGPNKVFGESYGPFVRWEF
jgi:hypothetical protein